MTETPSHWDHPSNHNPINEADFKGSTGTTSSVEPLLPIVLSESAKGDGAEPTFPGYQPATGFKSFKAEAGKGSPRWHPKDYEKRPGGPTQDLQQTHWQKWAAGPQAYNKPVMGLRTAAEELHARASQRQESQWMEPLVDEYREAGTRGRSAGGRMNPTRFALPSLDLPKVQGGRIPFGNCLPPMTPIPVTPGPGLDAQTVDREDARRNGPSVEYLSSFPTTHRPKIMSPGSTKILASPGSRGIPLTLSSPSPINVDRNSLKTPRKEAKEGLIGPGRQWTKLEDQGPLPVSESKSSDSWDGESELGTDEEDATPSHDSSEPVVRVTKPVFKNIPKYIFKSTPKLPGPEPVPSLSQLELEASQKELKENNAPLILEHAENLTKPVGTPPLSRFERARKLLCFPPMTPTHVTPGPGLDAQTVVPEDARRNGPSVEYLSRFPTTHRPKIMSPGSAKILASPGSRGIPSTLSSPGPINVDGSSLKTPRKEAKEGLIGPGTQWTKLGDQGPLPVSESKSSDSWDEESELGTDEEDATPSHDSSEPVVRVTKPVFKNIPKYIFKSTTKLPGPEPVPSLSQLELEASQKELKENNAPLILEHAENLTKPVGPPPLSQLERARKLLCLPPMTPTHVTPGPGLDAQALDPEDARRNGPSVEYLSRFPTTHRPKIMSPGSTKILASPGSRGIPPTLSSPSPINVDGSSLKTPRKEAKEGLIGPGTQWTKLGDQNPLPVSESKSLDSWDEESDLGTDEEDATPSHDSSEPVVRVTKPVFKDIPKYVCKSAPKLHLSPGHEPVPSLSQLELESSQKELKENNAPLILEHAETLTKPVGPPPLSQLERARKLLCLPPMTPTPVTPGPGLDGARILRNGPSVESTSRFPPTHQPKTMRPDIAGILVKLGSKVIPPTLKSSRQIIVDRRKLETPGRKEAETEFTKTLTNLKQEHAEDLARLKKEQEAERMEELEKLNREREDLLAAHKEIKLEYVRLLMEREKTIEELGVSTTEKELELENLKSDHATAMENLMSANKLQLQTIQSQYLDAHEKLKTEQESHGNHIRALTSQREADAKKAKDAESITNLRQELAEDLARLKKEQEAERMEELEKLSREREDWLAAQKQKVKHEYVRLLMEREKTIEELGVSTTEKELELENLKSDHATAMENLMSANKLQLQTIQSQYLDAHEKLKTEQESHWNHIRDLTSQREADAKKAKDAESITNLRQELAEDLARLKKEQEAERMEELEKLSREREDWLAAQKQKVKHEYERVLMEREKTIEEFRVRTREKDHELGTVKADQVTQIAVLNSAHKLQLQAIQSQHLEELKTEQDSHRNHVQALTSQREVSEKEVKNAETGLKSSTAEYEDVRRKYERLKEECLALEWGTSKGARSGNTLDPEESDLSMQGTLSENAEIESETEEDRTTASELSDSAGKPVRKSESWLQIDDIIQGSGDPRSQALAALTVVRNYILKVEPESDSLNSAHLKEKTHLVWEHARYLTKLKRVHEEGRMRELETLKREREDWLAAQKQDRLEYEQLLMERDRTIEEFRDRAAEKELELETLKAAQKVAETGQKSSSAQHEAFRRKYRRIKKKCLALKRVMSKGARNDKTLDPEESDLSMQGTLGKNEETEAESASETSESAWNAAPESDGRPKVQHITHGSKNRRPSVLPDIEPEEAKPNGTTSRTLGRKSARQQLDININIKAPAEPAVTSGAGQPDTNGDGLPRPGPAAPYRAPEEKKGVKWNKRIPGSDSESESSSQYRRKASRCSWEDNAASVLRSANASFIVLTEEVMLLKRQFERAEYGRHTSCTSSSSIQDHESYMRNIWAEINRVNSLYELPSSSYTYTSRHF